MKLLDEIKNEWKAFAYAMVGSLLLAIGFVLCLMQETGYGAIFTVVGGAIDLPIIFKKMRTITSWVRGQFERWLDRSILVIKLGLIAYFVLFQWSEPSKYDVLLVAANCIIAWHLFANEARN